MNKYLVTTLFLDNTKSVPKSVTKTYDYIIEDSLFSQIEVGPSAGSDRTTIYLTSYNIQNTDGYDYRGSKVVFLMVKPYKPEKGDNLIALKHISKVTNKEEIVCLTSHYNKELLPIISEKNKNGWYTSKTSLLLGVLFNAVGNDMTTNSITADKLGSSNCCCTSSTSNTVSGSWINTGTSTGDVLKYDSNWITTTPYTTTDWTVTLGNYPAQSEIDEIKKRLDELENNKKENKKMFDSLTKNLKCGRAQDVRMSIYGPAFKGEDGSWYSVDIDGEMTDVSDLLFDMDSYCYMMPVPKNAIVEGDFILHNGHWVKVIEYGNGCVMNAVDTFNKQFIVPTVTKSPFGFEFYTKLVQLLDFSKMPISAENPFGMLPMMFMLNNKNEKDMLPMLMMMGTQNGGLNFDMSNPLMMYLMMKDGDNSNLLPFLMMGQMQKSE